MELKKEARSWRVRSKRLFGAPTQSATLKLLVDLPFNVSLQNIRLHNLFLTFAHWEILQKFLAVDL